MTLPRFDYLAPTTLAQACAALAENRGDARVMAGGTDLLLKMERTGRGPRFIVGLAAVSGLDHVRFDPKEGLVIGARAVLSAVADHPDVERHYAALAEATAATATVQIRNMGTVVGNLCNASPSADTAPPLIALEGEVIAVRKDPSGPGLLSRTIPVEELFRGPGITVLHPSELVREVRVPAPRPRSGSAIQRISERSEVDIAAVLVSAAVSLGADGRCVRARIALGAVAPVPMRAEDAERAIEGSALDETAFAEAGALAARASRPISDVRASAEWRRNMVEVLTTRALRSAAARARGREERST